MESVGDGTYGEETAGDTYTYDDTLTEASRRNKGNTILKRLFESCEDDALGSVHRAWAVTVLFMVFFVIIACIEGECSRRGEKCQPSRIVLWSLNDN